jgi:probable O-glycosylation ligase (exosortase A-associated)
MRSALVLAVILGSVPLCFFSPYFGVLMWSWVAYFNPHRFTYGIAYTFPVAWAIAIPTLTGTLITKEKNRQIQTRETILLFILWVWFAVTLFHAMQVPMFAAHIESGKAELIKVSKILLMTFVTIVLMTSKEKLRKLCLVLTLSIGLLAVKCAIFGFRTSGQSRVWGPPDSFLSDNNALGLAINMTLPILFFMAREEKNRWLRLFMRFCFFCGIVSVVLTYSRGGLLGLAVVLTVLAIKANRKLVGIAALALCGFLILTYAPEKWMARMDAFVHGNLDTSAQGRLHAWQFALVFTQDYPITGGGFQTFTPDLFERYTPELSFAGPHSIYFQVLGEQGYVGLVLFLSLLGSVWWTLRKLRRPSRVLPSTRWMISYSHMLETSLYAYMVSGAFLPLAYFDFYFQVIAIVVVMKILYRRELREMVLSRSEEKSIDLVLPEAVTV